jgi:D-methionine transport system ATP-binding protein
MLDSLQPAAGLAPPAAAAAPPVVSLRGVTRRYGGVLALDDVSLAVAPGEVVGIIGRSGAGKSTLIRCLNGLERPDGGDVLIEGRDITRLTERALQPVRRRIGMIFQHFNLLSAKTAAANVMLPLAIGGRPRRSRRPRALELLDLVGLADKADAYPGQLSGGQKQRVGIARALAADPVLLLSDEATSALDPETTQSILALLGDISRRMGLTIVLITHEMSVVRSIADRVIVLEAGHVIEEGPTWRVFAEPCAGATRRLLRALRPELPDAIRARLHPEPRPGATLVVRVEVHGAAARAPLLAEAARHLGGAAVLLHGGIEHVGGRPVGTLFLGFGPTGAAGDLASEDRVAEDRVAEDWPARAAAFLAPRVSRFDVLGYGVLDD